MIVNENVYIKEYVIDSIKSNEFYKVGYERGIQLYGDDNWCNQFLSTKYQKFEVVVVRDVSGMNDGFYIVDSNYTKFTSSPFIQNLLSQIVRKEKNKNKVSMNEGMFFRNKTYSKSIDKFFINYIKNNLILYYTYNEFIEEFNPRQTQQSNNESFKSQHTVNGFWRKQQYGSRSNPQYKMIWINTFERGGKKVS